MINSVNNKTLLVLLGPTGVGKTDISLEIARYYGCPIVSSDSRQFYRELKIGTAAPTETQLSAVKHYFIGTHSIHDEYNCGQYELDVISLLDALFRVNDVVLLVGGSMMYIDAVCKGMDDIPTVDFKTRDFWKNEYAIKGLEFIQQELKRLDPEHYSQVDLKNYKRILHALEICTISGMPFSYFRTGKKKVRTFDIVKVGLNRIREELYGRINERVDQMMCEGLLAEAQQYYSCRHLNAMNTVGYKELYDYMDGKYDLEFAVNMIKQDSRRYAKRQMTWFNRDKEISWFHPNNKAEVFQYLKSKINF